MAHRIITQIAITGARVFGRAFTEAYKQANARRVAPGASAGSSGDRGGAGGGAALGGGTAGLTLQEACQILNLPPPKSMPTTSPTSIPFGTSSNETFSASEATKDLEAISERFKKLFDQNDPKKGGSFYLQSKVLRARERMEAEVGKRVEREREAAESKERPRVYKER